MGISAPEDRRFRRGRAAGPGPRRRRAARLALLARVAAAAALMAVMAAAGTWGVHASSNLRVGRVVISGNQQVSTGDLLARLDGLEGAAILDVDLEHWRRRLEEAAWVRHATLRRVLPDTIEVVVVEREPLAIGRLDGRLVLVDASGAVIDDFGPAYEAFDLPIIDGLTRRPSHGTPSLSPPQAALVAGLLGDLAVEPALLAKVSQVDVADPANAVLWLDDDPVRLLLGDREFRTRVSGYLEVRAALRARVPEIETVDLRFGRRVFVRPATDAAGGRTRAAAGAPRARS